jgi:hypothetical protein
MKIINRYIITAILALFIGVNQSKAQSFDQLITFGWDVNIPMGSDKYVDDISWAGAKFEFRKMIDEKMSLGFDLSWNSYYTYVPTQTFHLNASTDATTDAFKYLYTLPMAITAHWYFETPGIFIPYVGAGMGAVYSQPKLYFNIYEVNEENWGFLFRPEVGTIIKFDPTGDIGLMLGARYSWSTNEEPIFKITDLKALGFNLGFVWLY